MSSAKKKTGRKKDPMPKGQRSSRPVQSGTSADVPSASRHAELLRLERRQFSEAGKEQRIKRALEALRAFHVDFNLDLETIKWIAQAPTSRTSEEN